MLRSIKQSDVAVVESAAKDEQMSVTAHSNWTAATESTKRRLDRKCKEGRILHFYPGAVYEMTHNNPTIGFSQSQTAVLRQMPTTEEARAFENVQLLLAPPGCKTVPDDIEEPDELLGRGWTAVSVGELAQPRVHTFPFGIRGKRLQYAFRPRIAATMRATMGSDFEKIATSVSSTDEHYRLWEKEQAVVLLSRTFTAKNIIFVGDREDTITALATLIQTKSQYSSYISHLLDVLCGDATRHPLQPPPVVRNDIIPFRPMDVQLPQEGSGYCYIIVSLQNRETTYIGQTMSLVNRLNQHNKGTGSLQTEDAMLRPWSLLAFVCGFDHNKDLMRRFERDWQRRRQNLLQRNSISSPEQTADVARCVMVEWRAQGIEADLRYVLAGTFSVS
jgi:predicted GIY-YIG superfamily endonuclease